MHVYVRCASALPTESSLPGLLRIKVNTVVEWLASRGPVIGRSEHEAGPVFVPRAMDPFDVQNTIACSGIVLESGRGRRRLRLQELMSTPAICILCI